VQELFGAHIRLDPIRFIVPENRSHAGVEIDARTELGRDGDSAMHDAKCRGVSDGRRLNGGTRFKMSAA
jgi:hypothetical protein